MTVLAHDMPDDYDWLPGSSRSPIADLGELAARLGSINTYDRRGEVIWADSCAHGLAPYDIVSVSAGSSVRVSTQHTGLSGYSLQFLPAAIDNAYARVYKYFSLLSAERVGLEEQVVLHNDFKYHVLKLDYFSGSVEYLPTIRLNDVTFDLEYLDSGLAWQSFHSRGIPYITGSDHQHVKLVVDYNTHTYVRVLYNETEYDLTGILLPSAGVPDDSGLAISVEHIGDGFANRLAYLDHLLVTLNEP